MAKDDMQSLVSNIAKISSEIYLEGMMGLSAELKSTKELLVEATENTYIIRRQNEKSKLELEKVNKELRKAAAELEKLKSHASSKLTFTSSISFCKMFGNLGFTNVRNDI